MSILFARWIIAEMNANRALHRVITFFKIWTLNRGVYGTIRGFPAGVSWVIMVTTACLKHPHRTPLHHAISVIVRNIRTHDWGNVDFTTGFTTHCTNTDVMTVSMPLGVWDFNITTDHDPTAQPGREMNTFSAVRWYKLMALLKELDVLLHKLIVYTDTSRMWQNVCHNCIRTVHALALSDVAADSVVYECCMNASHPLFVMVPVKEPVNYQYETFVSARVLLRIVQDLCVMGCHARTISSAYSMTRVQETTNAKYESTECFLLLTHASGVIDKKGVIGCISSSVRGSQPYGAVPNCMALITRDVSLMVLPSTCNDITTTLDNQSPR